MTTTTIKARAKAFTGDGVREHKFQVESDGTIRVWDRVAGHYTLCHGLTKTAETRIRRLAAAK